LSEELNVSKTAFLQEKTEWHSRASQEDYSAIRAQFLEVGDKNDTFCFSSSLQIKHCAYSKGTAVPLKA